MTKDQAAKLFTADELAKARRIARDKACGILKKHREYIRIIEPAMERINKVTGMQNDTKFVAYVLEYAVT